MTTILIGPSVDLIGYAAAAASLVSFSSKTMIPLRAAAIVSNFLFIAYGIAGGYAPVAVLHLTLLPLNIHRLVSMKKLIWRVEQAAGSRTFDASWLRPYMARRSLPAGTVVFRKGDHAHEVYYLVSGRLRFPEIGKSADGAEGAFLFGEIGFFTPDGTRTLSCICETDVEFLAIENDGLQQLYFQNPEFGFHLVRLIVGRLMDQIGALQAEALGRENGPWRPAAEPRSGRAPEAAQNGATVAPHPV